MPAGRPSDYSQESSDRFWSKVDKTGNCWEWMAGKFSNGYGSYCVNNRDRGAHCFSMALSGVDVPRGTHVLHKCDNRSCVNPKHLFLGTNIDNVNDKMRKNRQARGAMCRTTLIDSDIIEIRVLKGIIGYKDIALKFKVCHSTISHIMNRRNWAHVN